MAFASPAHRITAALLATIVLLAGREAYLKISTRGAVHFFDVGQGDAALIVSPGGKQIVIDGGPNLALLESLGISMPYLDRTIELMIISHFDADHLTALPEVLQRYDVKKILINTDTHNSALYKKFSDLIEEKNIQTITANPSKDIQIEDDFILDIIWPPLKGGWERNNASIVFRLLHKNSSILFTGDIEKEAEIAILKTGAPLASHVLKIPHHGSKTSSSTGFLLAVDPTLAVLSVGEDNRYGHPHESVINRYTDLGIEIVNIAENGTYIIKL